MEQILQLDGGHGLANLILASLHIENEQYDLAEHALKRSNLRRPDPITYHDLAWLQEKDGRVDESMESIRKGRELGGQLFFFDDREAVLLMKKGALDEAQVLLLKVLSEQPGYVPAKLHLCELLIIRKDWGEVKTLLEELEAQTDRLGRYEQGLIREMKKQLEDKKNQ